MYDSVHVLTIVLFVVELVVVCVRVPSTFTNTQLPLILESLDLNDIKGSSAPFLQLCIAGIISTTIKAADSTFFIYFIEFRGVKIYLILIPSKIKLTNYTD